MDLRKDSDGDGLSDIAARHLLLDQPPVSGTPFIVGQERDCAAPSADTLARLEILKKIFAVEARALIEPAGPKKEPFGGWRRSASRITVTNYGDSLLNALNSHEPAAARLHLSPPPLVSTRSGSEASWPVWHAW